MQGSTIGWDRFISQKGRGETNGMILFESMLERARKNNVHIDRDRGIANGSLMLVAGMSFACSGSVVSHFEEAHNVDTQVRGRNWDYSSCQ